jgi:hypothetical protein
MRQNSHSHPESSVTFPVLFGRTAAPDRAGALKYSGELVVTAERIILRGSVNPVFVKSQADPFFAPIFHFAAWIQIRRAGKNTIEREFTPATVQMRYDADRRRFTLLDAQGQWWIIAVDCDFSVNYRQVRVGDPQLALPLAEALRGACPGFREGPINKWQLLAKWLMIILVSFMGLCILVLVAIYLLIALGIAHQGK